MVSSAFSFAALGLAFRLRKQVAFVWSWAASMQRSLQDMNLPGLDLHELKGRRRGTWAVRVSGNWRITFRFEGEDAVDVDYEDYH